MEVNAYKCTACGDLLYGRSDSDIQNCFCGRTRLTGDFKTPTIYINDEELLHPLFTELNLPNTTPEMLYWDFELQTNNTGHISEFLRDEPATHFIPTTPLIEL